MTVLDKSGRPLRGFVYISCYLFVTHFGTAVDSYHRGIGICMHSQPPFVLIVFDRVYSRTLSPSIEHKRI